MIRKFSERMGIRIFELGIQADHVHLAVRFPSREAYVRWIRALTSVLCQRIPGLKWKLRPYTKIATWGRGFHRLKAYIVHNHKGGELAGGAYAALARALWDVRKIVHESRARPGQ
ncbi:MAG TPA: transposase [Bdellovibrionales bacterium]|mgnify:CR=1 FL=1|nr:transposase [Bdellovibrionales bacterium]